MKKTVVMRNLSWLLVINIVCFLLAGCGAGQGSRADDSAGSSIDRGEGQNSVADDSANSSNDDSGDGQVSFLENPAYSANGRQVLTMVVPLLFRDTLEMIRDFNESSPSYFIEIRDYGLSGITDTVEMAEKLESQLALEILSGKGPDLVIWNYFYTPSLASEKLMEDLNVFMDADPDFHREDYYENILQAFEMNGGLYVLPTSFSVSTLCGKAEELGTDRGVTESWEFGEMLEAFENSPHAEQFSSYPNKEYTLRYVGGSCMGNYVDWSSGECHFDTPTFVELLELCNTLPEGFDDIPGYGEFYEILRSGKFFCEAAGVSSPWGVAAERAKFGEDLLWPGYPVADGEKDLGGGVAEPGSKCFSICRNSGNQEAAWEFVKSFLTEDAQREVGGPLLRSVAEEKIQEALTVEYETVSGIEQEKIRHEVIVEGEDIIGLTCVTERDVEIFRSIVENTHRSSSDNLGMMEIIMEEADVYFGGGKDAAAVADIIQNRVSIYVSERMK